MPGQFTRSEGSLQVLKISDFTSGIRSQKNTDTISQSSSVWVPNANQSISLSANSYGVMALPNGGLLLGPSVAQVVGAPVPSLPDITNGCAVGGIINNFLGYDNNHWTQINCLDAAHTAHGGVVRNDGMGAITAGFTGAYNGSAGAGIDVAFPTFPFHTTLVNATPAFGEYVVFSTPFYHDGTGGIVWSTANGATTGLLRGFPCNGWAIPGGGRVWLIEGGIVLPWVPSGTATTQIWNTISYTDPSIGTASNLTIGTQKTLIDYDNPASFGAWGQYATNEYFFVKTNRGGVIASGDIFNPSITVIPTVAGTNGLIGQARMTPIGLVYRSAGNGVWAWNGGASATKISAQLNDSLWPENAAANYVFPSNVRFPNFYNVEYYSNKIFFDGGFFYDIPTDSWWRLPPWASVSSVAGTTFCPYFYSTLNGNTSSVNGVFGDIAAVYMGAPSNLGANNLVATIYCFDMAFTQSGPPTGFYHSFYETNPIQFSFDDLVEVQEINIVMQGQGTMTANVLGIQGAVGTSSTWAVTNTNFNREILTCKFQTDVIILQLGWVQQLTLGVGPSFLPTPIIESIEIKYRSVAPLPRNI